MRPLFAPVALIAAWLATASACTAAPSEEVSWPDYLTVDGACGDAEFYARDPDGVILLHGMVLGIAAAALDEGRTVRADWTVPTEYALIEMAFGNNLAQYPCGGDPEAVLLDHLYEAESGRIVVSATPRVDGTVLGEMLFDDVVLVNVEGRGEPLVFDAFTVRGDLQP